jgi:hypothetical protein
MCRRSRLAPKSAVGSRPSPRPIGHPSPPPEAGGGERGARTAKAQLGPPTPRERPLTTHRTSRGSSSSSAGDGLPSGEKTRARASRASPSRQKRTSGSADRFRNHCDRCLRSVLTNRWSPSKTACRGIERRRPERRPVVSRTIRPVGIMPGENPPARTTGSTMPLTNRKKARSKVPGSVMALKDNTRSRPSRSGRRYPKQPEAGGEGSPARAVQGHERARGGRSRRKAGAGATTTPDLTDV